ncbi:sigma-54-dependent Fis family transcriptional regulator [Maridesulfovibrio bastinii]|uniref:sigma-54-dependent Fis family transcriptional regulator n=1 Tax=Maridesulfovibrio bastinii TaxID=47157 RepID=UPI000424D54A|nr:sigma-54-dependent Fis family transcriptional regulator [Maridesulfovibrio bastinii]
MHLLLRDGDGFEICTTPDEHIDIPTFSICCSGSQRGPKADYSKWKDFVEGHKVDLSSIDENIVSSWNRCRDMAVDPAPRSCWDFMPMSQLEPFTSTLEKICKDVESTAYEAIRSKGLLMTFTNAKARVARTCGDLEVLRQADRLNFGPGANWAEECVGTNAIGTALSTGRPMQVFGEEHFCQSHHLWNCTAAPILDPHGRIWGCFDISGPTSSDHSKNMELVLQATRALEQRLSSLYCSELEGHLGSLFSSMFNSVMTGVISLDASGKIISASSAAETLLGSPWGTLRGQRARDYFDYDDFLAKTKHSSMSKPIVMRCLVNPDLFVRGLTIYSSTGSRLDTVVTICEKQTHHQFAVSDERNQYNNQSTEESPEGFEHILHTSKCMGQVIRKAARAARTPSTVLLYGESGTGKELFARGIHKSGPRSEKPFIAMNCGAFSEELIQSELFGYNAGAFTGALKQGRAGRFQRADKGVLFLDEISEMPLSQQVNLLRVLEEKQVVPVGGTTPQPVDVKIVAATNKDLFKLVKQGQFREDLYYRLNVVGIELPPLRDRGDDVVLLAEFHLKRMCEDFGIECDGMTEEVRDILMHYEWPGNVRELVNCIEYAINNMSESWLEAKHLPESLVDKTKDAHTPIALLSSGFTLKDMEANTIREALDFYDGNISKTAKALGIGRNTLYAKMQRHGIEL